VVLITTGGACFVGTTLGVSTVTGAGGLVLTSTGDDGGTDAADDGATEAAVCWMAAVVLTTVDGAAAGAVVVATGGGVVVATGGVVVALAALGAALADVVVVGTVVVGTVVVGTVVVGTVVVGSVVDDGAVCSAGDVEAEVGGEVTSDGDVLGLPGEVGTDVVETVIGGIGVLGTVVAAGVATSSLRVGGTV